MQRLYSMFPAGGPGLGLALLRMMASIHLMALAQGRASPLWGAALLLLAILLVLGLLTPLVSSAGALAQVATATLGQDMTLPVALLMVDPLLLVLLGPGAYSCDARLFGRRLIEFGD